MILSERREERDDLNIVSVKSIVQVISVYKIWFLFFIVIGSSLGFYIGKKAEFYSSRSIFGRSHENSFIIKEEDKIKKVAANLFRDKNFTDYFATRVVENLKKTEEFSSNKNLMEEVFTPFFKGRSIDDLQEKPADFVPLAKLFFSGFLLENKQENQEIIPPPPFFKLRANNNLYEMLFSLPHKGFSRPFMFACALAFDELITYANQTELDRQLGEKIFLKKKAAEDFRKIELAYNKIQTSLQAERSRISIDFYKLVRKIEAKEITGKRGGLKIERYNDYSNPEYLSETYIEALERRMVLKQLAALKESKEISQEEWNSLLSEYNSISNEKERTEEKKTLLMTPYFSRQKQVVVRAEEETQQIDVSLFSLPGIAVTGNDLSESISLGQLDVLCSKKWKTAVAGAFFGVVCTLLLALGIAFFKDISKPRA